MKIEKVNGKSVAVVSGLLVVPFSHQTADKTGIAVFALDRGQFSAALIGGEINYGGSEHVTLLDQFVTQYALDSRPGHRPTEAALKSWIANHVIAPNESLVVKPGEFRSLETAIEQSQVYALRIENADKEPAVIAIACTASSAKNAVILYAGKRGPFHADRIAASGIVDSAPGATLQELVGSLVPDANTNPKRDAWSKRNIVGPSIAFVMSNAELVELTTQRKARAWESMMRLLERRDNPRPAARRSATPAEAPPAAAGVAPPAARAGLRTLYAVRIPGRAAYSSNLDTITKARADKKKANATVMPGHVIVKEKPDGSIEIVE